MKNLFDSHSEEPGCPESQRQTRIELAGLDGVDGLPGHIEGVGQLGLRPVALGGKMTYLSPEEGKQSVADDYRRAWDLWKSEAEHAQ